MSIVIPVRNGARQLKVCLAAIAANDLPPRRYEIIVCDNGSTDDSAAVARAHGCRVIAAPSVSVAALRNRAVAAARGDFVAFIDADHEIAPGWLRAAEAALRRPEVGAAGAPYDAPAEPTWVQRTIDADRRHEASGRVAWLPGGNLVVRRRALAECGGFDTTLVACEDVDLCRRLRRAGYAIVADTRLRSRHLGDPATLRQLFRAELWRGRDNLRVSVRAPRSWRTLASAAVPLAQLVAVPLAMAATFSGGRRALGLAAGLATAALLPTLARTIRIVAASSIAPRPAALQAALVALTHDAARALALVLNVDHRRATAGGHS